MMSKNGYRDDRLISSLENALAVLGEASKQTMIYYMTKYYGISFGGNKASSLEEIEAALRGILGSGAVIITEKLYSELQRVP
jgi:hypothetical protein